MQRVTRSNADNTLVQVEDPEQILRERRRSMAEQAKQGRGNHRETRDSNGEEYSEAEEVNTQISMYQTWTTHPCRELSETGWH